MNPRYPIYIPTKGRYESRKTIKALDRLGVPYRIVVEPQEVELYAPYVKANRILVLPWSNRPDGLVAARNWIWEHSLAEGAVRHWQMDDNITAFYRLNRNLRIQLGDGTGFRVCEDFADRYTNVAQFGLQYYMFAPRKNYWPAYVTQTRIYSCTCNLNALPHRYRDIYNDDTDISLRVLKDGWCTVLFNAFLADKETTMVLKGGNTEIYQGDGRLKMAQSLVKQHPDVTKITWRFGRWQHVVNYRPFRKTRLIRRPDFVLPEGDNEYGLVVKTLTELGRPKAG